MGIASLKPELEALKSHAGRAAEAKRLIGEIKARHKASKEKLADLKVR
jgi:hypothetical protein